MSSLLESESIGRTEAALQAPPSSQQQQSTATNSEPPATGSGTVQTLDQAAAASPSHQDSKQESGAVNSATSSQAHQLPQSQQDQQQQQWQSNKPQNLNSIQQQQHHHHHELQIVQVPLVQPRPTRQQSSSNPDTRTHVVGELYDTERSYVESLQILVEKYMRPLKNVESNRALADSNLVDEIFYTIPEILQHHENFLSSLQDRLSSDWDSSQVIGNVFIEAFTNQQIIDTYTAFINNWKNARHALKVATQSKPAFERFLEAMSREHRNKLTLDALLIMPVQRIPRYELLIKELIKHTPEDHPDHGPLIEAQERIHELALKIDRAEKEMLHQERLKELESLIDGHVELQHPQRDFIRYDLVTILGTSALTVTKKERVLFLFCDLLIMTSVKKKVSRRSNLQTAFANSSNDLSLLEGNKFKLLLRVPIDQVEVRVDNDQIQSISQQQRNIQLQMNHQLLQEKKREIESDLHTLVQLEALSSTINSARKIKLNETIVELSDQLRRSLDSIDQNDLQSISLAYQPSIRNNTIHDGSFVSQISNLSPAITQSQNNILAPQYVQTLSTSSQQQSQISGAMPSSISPVSSIATPNNLESNASLELIINSGGSPKDGPSANIGHSSSINGSNIEQNRLGDDQSTISETHAQSGPPSESLLVTFSSLERRQAFLQAFVEAKQQRYQLQQQQQQQKIFSSSITLKLSHPSSPERRSLGHDPRRRLQHQTSIDARSQPKISKVASLCDEHYMNTDSTRIASAPPSQDFMCGSSIAHQMSAPHSLPDSVKSQIDQNHQNAFGCNNCPNHFQTKTERRRHHHHHQLIHQPASQPALLDTICCNELHDGAVESNKPTSLRSGRSEFSSELNLCELNDESGTKLSNSSILALNIKCKRQDDSTPAAQQRMETLTDLSQALLFKTAPKFLVALPMSFLNVQHPSLQFTCSAHYNSCGGVNYIQKELGSQSLRNQTFQDRSGQMWLCMSNGYVSHIALISIKKQYLQETNEAKGQNSNQGPKYFNVLPIVQSASDICKSQITCAAQVKWYKKSPAAAESIKSSSKNVVLDSPILKKSSDNEDGQNVATNQSGGVKNPSPPLDIKRKIFQHSSETTRLSESAPSNTDRSDVNVSQALNKVSNSVTWLRVPSNSCQISPSTNKDVQAPGIDSAHHLPPLSRPGIQHDLNQLRNSACPNCSTTQPQFLKCNQGSHRAETCNQRIVDTVSSHILSRNQRSLHQPLHHLYNTRHSTVPIAELRSAFERQNKIYDFFPKVPMISPGPMQSQVQKHVSSLDLAGHSRKNEFKKTRSSTPPDSRSGSRSLRPSRLLKHQASLKTSSILAKLVGGATKRSYLKKSANVQDKHNSDQEDNELDSAQTSRGNISQGESSSLASRTKAANNSLTVGPKIDGNTPVISPLSSVSSLNSTTSSLTVNSVSASLPNPHGSYDLLAHSSSLICCAGPNGPCQTARQLETKSPEVVGIRSRSATVPSRACFSKPDLKGAEVLSNLSERKLEKHKNLCGSDDYKVSDILTDSNQTKTDHVFDESENISGSALWIGCDDGSLIIIDCLTGVSEAEDDCNPKEIKITCDNTHSEIKLGAEICDICPYKDKLVFVALANGQLAVFSKDSWDTSDLSEQAPWLLANPRIVTVATKELNSTSKLCLVGNDRLWYSHGRNIFVLDIVTLRVETSIMAPTNDLSLQFTLQSVAIDNMELVCNLGQVWVSFKNSYLIQLYDASTHKLLMEVNLYDPINKVLSYGNEIIRQHKTACLKATSLLSVENTREKCSTLFIGTSAGILLYLTLPQDKISHDTNCDSVPSDWTPQVASLRHGHSGNVKFIQVVDIGLSKRQNDQATVDGCSALEENRELFLISGGAGVDVYGPQDENQFNIKLNNEEDNLNHLMLWKL